MERPTYLFIGAGGVGGYYGARLAEAGIPVRWVVRSDVDHIRRHGLHVRSPRGDVHLRELEVYGPQDAPPPTQVVVLATKTLENPQLAARVADAVAPGGTVVLLQNGLDVERPVADALAAAGRDDVTVLGAMSFICAYKAGPGDVRHLDYEAVTVGEFDPDGAARGVTGAVQRLVDDLSAAGVPAEALDDLLEGRWRKLCWNVPFNGLSVLLDATTAELVGDPSCRELVTSLMQEVMAAAAAHGHPFAPETIAKMLASTERMTPYAPSMKVDFDARRPLELDAIYRVPLETAASVGSPMPRTEALLRALRFLDARNRGGDATVGG